MALSRRLAAQSGAVSGRIFLPRGGTASTHLHTAARPGPLAVSHSATAVRSFSWCSSLSRAPLSRVLRASAAVMPPAPDSIRWYSQGEDDRDDGDAAKVNEEKKAKKEATKANASAFLADDEEDVEEAVTLHPEVDDQLDHTGDAHHVEHSDSSDYSGDANSSAAEKAPDVLTGGAGALSQRESRAVLVDQPNQGKGLLVTDDALLRSRAKNMPLPGEVGRVIALWVEWVVVVLLWNVPCRCECTTLSVSCRFSLPDSCLLSLYHTRVCSLRCGYALTCFGSDVVTCSCIHSDMLMHTHTHTHTRKSTRHTNPNPNPHDTYTFMRTHPHTPKSTHTHTHTHLSLLVRNHRIHSHRFFCFHWWRSRSSRARWAPPRSVTQSSCSCCAW
jgi:hypothetical protein